MPDTERMPTTTQLFPLLCATRSEEGIKEMFEREFDPANRFTVTSIAAAFDDMVDDGLLEVETMLAIGSDALDVIDDVVEAGSFAHEALTFAIGTMCAEVLQHRGERIGAIAHLQRALCRPSLDGGWEAQPERLRLWEPLSDYLDMVLLELTLRHCAAWFGAAWRQPALDDLADVMWENAAAGIVAALDLTNDQLAPYGLTREASLTWAIHTAMHGMQWALRSGRRNAQEHYALWEPLLDSDDLPRVPRKMLLSFGATSAEPVSARPHAELAELLLNEFEGDLSPPLLLRAHCSACGGDEEELIRRLPEIVDACERHRTFDEGEDIVTIAYSRSQNSVAIAWAIRTLVHSGRLPEALTILRAWLPTSPEDPPTTAPLLMLPTSRVGTIWASAAGVVPDPAGPDVTTLIALNEAMDKTFNTTHEFRSDRPWDALSGATGLPVGEHANEFELRAEQHLHLEQLAHLVPALPEATVLVPWPMLRVPTQALTVRRLRKMWPIGASLAEPQPERALRNVIVMGEGSQTSEMERRAVRAAFDRSTANVVDLGAATLDAFIAAYEDPEVDVLWVCSHGFQNPTRPHRSGLHLDDDHFAELSLLAGLRRPRGDRRLLMLNVCDAGAAPMMEGSWALGVAAVLAGASQTVVGHMWPVNPFAAVAFASLLATELASSSAPSHAQPFERALAKLGHGQQAIVAALRDAELAEVADRVANNDIGWDSVLTWGSPVLAV